MAAIADQSNHYANPIDLDSEQARSDLAKLVSALLERWKLSSKERLELLGLSATSRAMLKEMSEGRPLPKSRDVLDRAGLLLSIHKSLRLLYPRNPDLRYGFVTTQNEVFGNFRPMDIMAQSGLIGIAKVARYLDRERGR